MGPLPAVRNGFVTFGSFNGSQKIHPQVVSLWSAVLKAVEGSRLMMKCTGGEDPGLIEYYLRQFENEGIQRDRVQIRGWLLPQRHLDPYNEVDVALDTFPFNGCITTLEALWMGVPAVTLKGQTLVSRVGLTILGRMGLGRLVSETTGQYVDTAAGLARNLPALAKIRSSLRSRMAASPVCDADRYTREMESACRQMWRAWCQGRNSELRTQNSGGGIRDAESTAHSRRGIDR